MTKRPFIVAVDFDCTLARYEGWQGYRTELLPPNEGMPELIRKLKKDGCKIIIWTCRNEPKNIERYCEAYEIPIDGVNKSVDDFNLGSPKVFADVYLDDRGLHYNGSSKGLYEEINKRRQEWLDSKES